jgi:hypothetical protein
MSSHQTPTIAHELESITVGDPVHFGGLTIFPLFRGGSVPPEPGYTLLEEAVSLGIARVTEVGEGGSVPELRFENLGEKPVLLLDGEELIGAKQTLVRAKQNHALLSGYHAGAENRNVVQLVKGETQNRDRYFLGFNTPYRPEILVSTSVGQEGIDLHRECRHVIHHDLCWNPATIEQRTGRVDRIGSKVERERMGVSDGGGPRLEIAVPYLAATYDERMFEELYRRAQLFEVTLGGEMRVEGRIDPEQVTSERRRREKQGIGTDDEDLGHETEETGVVDLPSDMVERLRVDLSVWKPPDA